jgi:hypothetical protein
MKKKKLLVVDASVARAAGNSEHPISSACRQILTDILEICHSVALNPELRQEWNHHQSRFTRKWRASMAARRKPLHDISTAPCGLDLDRFDEKNRAAIEKDLHLLELALATDKEIITLDTALSIALKSQSSGVRLHDRISWIDPIVDRSRFLQSAPENTAI